MRSAPLPWWSDGIAAEELLALYATIPAKRAIVERVPPEALAVLDIGCANGATGAELKRRNPRTRVVGVEMYPPAAELARQALDEVITADASTLPEDRFARETFDCAICADVLEHLVAPRELLKKVRLWMRPSGLLIASLPNVAHHSVIRGLLRGRWDYADEGVLDRGHLRFFGRANAEELVTGAGFRVEEVAGDAELLLKGWKRSLIRTPIRRFLDSGFVLVASARD
jgi:O-antigen biosynthesis protein